MKILRNHTADRAVLRIASSRSIWTAASILLILGIFFSSAVSAEELVWIRRDPPTIPAPPRAFAMTYDEARREVVFFGGYTHQLVDHTWAWDGKDWSVRLPAISPQARLHHAFAYDSVRQRVVLFGGRDAPGPGLADTWEWDGGTWEKRTPEVSPPPRWGHALAYDSKRQRVLLFGGSLGKEYQPTRMYDDMWEWDGEGWRQLTSEVSPSPRRGHGMTYDSDRDRVVLFGGADVTNFSQNDTWEWDGSIWSERQTNPVIYRHYSMMTYDTDRERVILFGGQWDDWFATTLFHNDLAEWDGQAWTNAYPPGGPSHRGQHGLAYDMARRELVLFGGIGLRSYETWVYRSPDETICDEADDNGNGLVDEGCADGDSDGFCGAGMIVLDPTALCPAGGGDCDDSDASVFPGAVDLPGDALDQDCDGTIVCNPESSWPNHGRFVSCVSQECDRLGEEGSVSRETCDDLIRQAARSRAVR